MVNKWIALFCSMALVAGLAIGHFAWTPGVARTETLTIFHAGSLAVPFGDVADEFESTHPNVDVLLESSGSGTAIRKITELERQADILASADYTLIPSMMYHDYADWYIQFARNKLVLCYRDGAPFADEINSGARTWYDVLRNENVTYGHSNPDDDPCGYRALMVCQLAQTYYYDEAGNFGLTPDPNANGLYNALIQGTGMDQGRVGGIGEVVRSKSVDLIALLQSGDLDYAFEYQSVAAQHGVNYFEISEDGLTGPGLIDPINLSQESVIPNSTIGQHYEGEAGFYWEASVEIQKSPTETRTIHGKPIVYGITIPKNAQNKELAIEFIALLLSEQGQEIMEVNGQPPIVPALCDYPERLPIRIEAAP